MGPKILLFVHLLLAFFCQSSAAAVCQSSEAEEAQLPTNNHQAVFLNDEAENNTFLMQSEGVPFTEPIPLTAAKLRELVQKDFADKIDPNLFVTQVMSHVMGDLHNWNRYITLSWVFQVNIRVPWLATCRPVIRGHTPLAQGLVCPGTGTSGCSQTTRFRVVETYTNTEFMRIETTLSAGASYKGVEASISTTRERTWEKVWGRTDETEVEYTWNLTPGARCTPSMVHVEVECDVNYDTVWYDSYFRRPKTLTELEYRRDLQRGGGPFRDTQWCFTQRVSQQPLSRNADWNPVLTDDGGSDAGASRGDIWHRPASEMNNFRIGTLGRRITNEDVIIRRDRGDKNGDLQEIFVCQRNPRTRTRGKRVFPLSSNTGVLQGYIGCISA